MKKGAYFENVPEVGDLHMIEVLFTFEQMPIEFICLNKQGDTFLCHCSEIRKVQRWIISPCSIEIIGKLVNDKISIYEALAAEPLLHRYIAERRYSKGETENRYTATTFDKIDSLDLPDEDVLLEAFNEDEARELIAYIFKEQEEKMKLDAYKLILTQSIEVITNIFKEQEKNTTLDAYKLIVSQSINNLSSCMKSTTCEISQSFKRLEKLNYDTRQSTIMNSFVEQTKACSLTVENKFLQNNYHSKEKNTSTAIVSNHSLRVA